MSANFWNVEVYSLLILSCPWSDSAIILEILSAYELTVIEKGNNLGTSLAKESSCFLSTK